MVPASAVDQGICSGLGSALVSSTCPPILGLVYGRFFYGWGTWQTTLPQTGVSARGRFLFWGVADHTAASRRLSQGQNFMGG